MSSGWQRDTAGERGSGAATLLAGPVQLGPGWAAQGEGGEEQLVGHKKKS